MHVFIWFCSVSPEFSYRTGLGVVNEGASTGSSPSATGSGGAPNRPLPPTPDDDESQGDKTLVVRRVRIISNALLNINLIQDKVEFIINICLKFGS